MAAYYCRNARPESHSKIKTPETRGASRFLGHLDALPEGALFCSHWAFNLRRGDTPPSLPEGAFSCVGEPDLRTKLQVANFS